MSGFMGLMGTYPISGSEYRAGQRTVARKAQGAPARQTPDTARPRIASGAGDFLRARAGRGEAFRGSEMREGLPYGRDVLVEPVHVPDLAGAQPAQFVVVLEGLGGGGAGRSRAVHTCRT